MKFGTMYRATCAGAPDICIRSTQSKLLPRRQSDRQTPFVYG
jgi:hypothetical protein